jgi:hypothetical protein
MTSRPTPVLPQLGEEGAVADDATRVVLPYGTTSECTIEQRSARDRAPVFS